MPRTHQSQHLRYLPAAILVTAAVAAACCLLSEGGISLNVPISSPRYAQREVRQALPAVLDSRQRDASFYQRLSEGLGARVLVLGDSIGRGQGASDEDHGWTHLLVDELEDRYGAEVELTNLSMGGTTSFAGYVRLMELEDPEAFDLVILCFGQNDAEKDFDIYYEALIHCVKMRCPRASILCTLESSQDAHAEKMQVIRSLAFHYRLPVIDTITASETRRDQLLVDGIHPSDAGHEVYYQTALGVIGPLIALHHGHDLRDIPPLHKEVEAFERFAWFPVEDFTRVGNTYTLTLRATATILGIEYTYFPGINTCTFVVDGEKLLDRRVKFTHNFVQRQIKVANDWLAADAAPLTIARRIEVVFSEDALGTKQADAFYGLILSGSADVDPSS